MKYLYRQEWREKCVTLETVFDWTRRGKYRRRVEAVRVLDEIAMTGGMVSGPLAAGELPVVRPAITEDGGYTGMVLLSFRVEGGVEVLERLRGVVNLWEQTLMSFVGSSGQSLKVLIPYRLVGGGLPAEAAQVALFQQYAYKRAAEYAFASTGMKAEETVHDGTEHFRLSCTGNINDDRGYGSIKVAVKYFGPLVGSLSTSAAAL